MRYLILEIWKIYLTLEFWHAEKVNLFIVPSAWVTMCPRLAETVPVNTGCPGILSSLGFVLDVLVFKWNIIINNCIRTI